MVGSEFVPAANADPSGVEINCIIGTQPDVASWHSFCSKISGFGFGGLLLEAVERRLLAVETNETNVPVFPIAGCELGPFPGVIPSGDETRYVTGAHVVVVVGDDCDRGVAPSHIFRR
jgi:hypothetical protein